MIRHAVHDDLDNIMKIISETIEFMALDNNTQWDKNYPSRQNFQCDIDAHSLYVIEENKNLCGFICINDVEPNEYGDVMWSDSGECLVVHRMAVSVAYRHQGVGTKLLSYVKTLAKDKKIHLIKSDTYSLNPKMNALFQKCGYEKVGEINLLNKPYKFNCYEKLLY
ncbi:GNAT family N-acetyltransferase [Clostridium tetani]|uniref:GNAT family N-acetyltransferase n=1 Tax=Clostridium tetani TaxID=1513 RepID=UPI00100B0E68|nr:GNAT family N-acetyltransferase [Clostridium tetani]RXM58920.1 GNAT family N-acetyltransferase [Clostridium tetani]RXM79344.1 GNAT family N-acetyltransferase [Clostridium tetani]RYV00156.1 GNAT family N-acetyltransferase [Clostridium tetani]